MLVHITKNVTRFAAFWQEKAQYIKSSFCSQNLCLHLHKNISKSKNKFGHADTFIFI